MSEAFLEQRPESQRLRGLEQGIRSFPDDEHAGVHPWRRPKARRGQPPNERQLPPWDPREAEHGARPRPRTLPRQLPLDDQRSPFEARSRIAQQQPQEPRRRIERNVRDDAEWKARERLPEGIALDDEHGRVETEPSPEPPRERRIDFERDDVAGPAVELCRDDPFARADLEHEVLFADAGE